jgi:hypothetical protein
MSTERRIGRVTIVERPDAAVAATITEWLAAHSE